MDSVNRDNSLKVFTDGRMAPWELDHKTFIDLEIKKLAIDPETEDKANELRKLYDEKHAAYLLENPVPVGVDKSLEFFGEEPKQENAIDVESVEPKKRRAVKDSPTN